MTVEEMQAMFYKAAIKAPTISKMETMKLAGDAIGFIFYDERITKAFEKWQLRSAVMPEQLRSKIDDNFEN